MFERGATISGRPLLWLPLERNLPPGIHSPRQYGGKLVSVNVAGKPPLLFDAGKRELGPLFVGVSQVNIRKRFDLYRIFAQAAPIAWASSTTTGSRADDRWPVRP